MGPKDQDNIKRVLFLSGIAVALIYCGLTFTSLSGVKRGGFHVVSEKKSARALAEEIAQLQQPQRAPVSVGGSSLSEHTGLDGHNHGPDEPCGEKCSKHHSHLDMVQEAAEGKGESTEPARFAVVKPAASPLYSMTADGLDGRPVALSGFAGKVLLVTNVASACGYTEQNYQGLQRLHDMFRDRGFEVLAWPCNQFGNQEPGDSQTISEFVKSRYNVTFPVFAKVDVNGPAAHPVFTFLKGVLGPGAADAADWNFNKYLVDRRGFPVKHYASAFEERVLEADILAELGRPQRAAATSTA
ncbi:hypothetical protein WJX81_001989 [Elliptochloris bilobata]|uniref:Glutathione peroxidase n=1 Tax=Elliptochloris bilobata TaxID=381761 RepID=A0AAW1SKU2_9CHLO